MIPRIACALLVAALAFATSNSLHAHVRLPHLFSNHMVVQQGTTVPVWGWAEPDEKVTVTLADQTATATADPQGKWLVKLSAIQPGGPYTLVVAGKNKLTVEDVLAGEVWLGSGQSNMAMQVKSSNHADKAVAAGELPLVRMFTVRSGSSKTPADDCEGQWVVCTPQTVGMFSATLFYFGREIHKVVGGPVGLINSSVGGTPIELWIDADKQHALPELKEFFAASTKELAALDSPARKASYERDLAAWKKEAAQAKADKKPIPRAPADPADLLKRKSDIGGLFNGKIAPLVPYAIRGAVWYQGEANARPAIVPYYRHQLSLLVRDWRARWGYDFPMAWVQLPNLDGRGENWVLVREGMLQALSVPKTGMAITLDIGDSKNVHPGNKAEVGRRLSLWALAQVYDRSDLEYSGPTPASHERQGSSIVVKFQHAAGGLMVKGKELSGFEICGADGAWKPAAAKIDGDRVMVSSADVPEPKEVRYAWRDDPTPTLFNAAGLPASSFRTGTPK